MKRERENKHDRERTTKKEEKEINERKRDRRERRVRERINNGLRTKPINQLFLAFSSSC